MKLLNLSLEDLEEPNCHVELEHVFYGQITDFKQLEKADQVIRQEQWEVKLPFTGKNAAQGSIRVRKTVEGDEINYTLTIKIALNDNGDKIETNIDSTPEQFIQLKFLANHGMVKTRYRFNVDGGLYFDVDVFDNNVGGQHQWCKIDLEVPSKDTPIPELPITLKNIITEDFSQRTKEQSDKVSTLYKKYFLTNNEYKSKEVIREKRDDVKRNENDDLNEVLMD